LTCSPHGTTRTPDPLHHHDLTAHTQLLPAYARRCCSRSVYKAYEADSSATSSPCIARWLRPVCRSAVSACRYQCGRVSSVRG